MIRVAQLGDIPKIIELGRELHEESCYSSQQFDTDIAEQKIASLINGDGVVFLAEQDGVIIGGFAGGLSQQWFSKEKIAFDYSLFISKSCRHGITALKLIRAFEYWAKEVGASRVVIGITTKIHPEATARLYKAAGYQPSGNLFDKELL
ncbi:GNAT family N-acetyltransferase [Salmonella enterica subsp. enterica serovar Mississippi]|uniref:N-acetyltransferase n=1 Tax=Salmonella enterica subsp. enterica serovar Cardoner TaxID=2564309 RepID=A0A5V6PW33_SALET|nr:GNAT family N-acetyltransferase [Salmonella enterica]EAB6210851.1 GNAT family N-acetyltransferase [Salmonella enterica subsp. enterica serovar Agbeni]EAC1238163.1 GNAT family N-acetyltransferase [Salmonella enterica subsp. enterica]EBF8123383.1 GNAT family N-acetyltransferase [Salmonella enterica subsp. enterica serovar Aba]EBU7763831.1 N-acetyltransferase [Salmonella enterica subsp. enterica serovar Rovaniemi]EBU8204125.1 N-acetyltransferase [Salmonella enterica subsp. enterica serovar Car